MDPENVARMKEHYNSHATGVDVSGSGQRGHNNMLSNQIYSKNRYNSGPVNDLRKFHNDVKRQLIYRFVRAGDKLLDLACGRGGDLRKWIDAGVAEVLGLDLSPMEIEEAKKRFKEIEKQASKIKVDFRQTDLLGVEEVPFIRKSYYSVCTCMFAAHYFLASEDSFHCFMKTIADALVDGGYFLGTMPEGKAILKLLNQKMAWTRPWFSLHAKWGKPTVEGCHPPPKAFGSGFTYNLANTVTEGGEGSYEYLVFFSVFKGVAEKFGLHPVLDYSDPESYNDLLELLHPHDSKEPFKHFYPRYRAGIPEEIVQASSINVAFAFQKKATSQNRNTKDAHTRKEQIDVDLMNTDEGKKRKRTNDI